MHPQTPAVSMSDLPDPLPVDVVVLDVREDEEWENGHIEGAVHVPLMQLPGRIDELPEGRMLVVCKIGGRSHQAVDYLLHRGFDAVNLDGGMIEWAGAGRPLVTERDAPPRVV